jgi:tetratricopeptide (TPR) repeat protein
MKTWMKFAIVPAVLAAMIPVSAFANEKLSNEATRQIACGRSEKHEMKQDMQQDKKEKSEMNSSTNARWQAQNKGQWSQLSKQPNWNESTEQIWMNAKAAFMDKKFNEASRLYETLLTQEPQASISFAPLAMSYFELGEFEKANQFIEKAIEANPMDNKLLLSKADILDGLKQPQAAMKHYFMFSALEPKDTNAVVATRRGEEIYRMMEKSFETQDKAFIDGIRFMAWQAPQKALPLLEESVKMEPTNLDARMFLGLAHRELNHPTEAIQQFQAITQTEPSNANGFYQLGELYKETGDKKNADKAWQSFLKTVPQREAIQSWVESDFGKKLPNPEMYKSGNGFERN